MGILGSPAHTLIACRCQARAVSGFQEGLQSIAVKGASWDLQQPVSDAALEIDAHINKLRAQKVRVAPRAQSGRITLSVESQLLAVLLNCQKQSKQLRVE